MTYEGDVGAPDSRYAKTEEVDGLTDTLDQLLKKQAQRDDAFTTALEKFTQAVDNLASHIGYGYAEPRNSDHKGKSQYASDYCHTSQVHRSLYGGQSSHRAQNHYYTPPPVSKAHFVSYHDVHDHGSINGQAEGFEEETVQHYNADAEWDEHPWHINPNEEPITYYQNDKPITQRELPHNQPTYQTTRVDEAKTIPNHQTIHPQIAKQTASQQQPPRKTTPPPSPPPPPPLHQNDTTITIPPSISSDVVLPLVTTKGDDTHMVFEKENAKNSEGFCLLLSGDLHVMQSRQPWPPPIHTFQLVYPTAIGVIDCGKRRMCIQNLVMLELMHPTLFDKGLEPHVLIVEKVDMLPKPPWSLVCLDDDSSKPDFASHITWMQWTPFCGDLQVVQSMQPWSPPMSLVFLSSTYLDKYYTASCVLDHRKSGSEFILAIRLHETPLQANISVFLLEVRSVALEWKMHVNGVPLRPIPWPSFTSHTVSCLELSGIAVQDGKRASNFGTESILVCVEPTTKVKALGCCQMIQIQIKFDISLLVSALLVEHQFLHCVCFLSIIEHKFFLNHGAHNTEAQLKKFMSVMWVMCIEVHKWWCWHSAVQFRVLFPVQVYTSLSIVLNGSTKKLQNHIFTYGIQNRLLSDVEKTHITVDIPYFLEWYSVIVFQIKLHGTVPVLRQLTGWECSSYGKTSIAKSLICISEVRWKFLQQWKHMKDILGLLLFCGIQTVEMAILIINPSLSEERRFYDDQALPTVQVSMHALLGIISNSNTFTSKLQISNKISTAMVDSGGVSLIDARIVLKANYCISTVSGVKVVAANGQEVLSSTACLSCPYIIQDHEFQLKFRLLAVQSYGIILGTDGIYTESPVGIDLKRRKFSVTRKLCKQLLMVNQFNALKKHA